MLFGLHKVLIWIENMLVERKTNIYAKRPWNLKELKRVVNEEFVRIAQEMGMRFFDDYNKQLQED